MTEFVLLQDQALNCTQFLDTALLNGDRFNLKISLNTYSFYLLSDFRILGFILNSLHPEVAFFCARHR